MIKDILIVQVFKKLLHPVIIQPSPYKPPNQLITNTFLS